MNTCTVKYLGNLPDGRIADPVTKRDIPFERGQSVTMPTDTAIQLHYQDPASWGVPEAIKTAVKTRINNEKAAVEVANKAAEKSIAAAALKEKEVLAEEQEAVVKEQKSKESPEPEQAFSEEPTEEKGEK